MQKKNGIFNIILIVLLAILLGLISYLVFYNKEDKVFAESVKDKLIISTFSSNSIGNIILYDPVENSIIPAIQDKKVGVTGDISNDGSKVAYVDALSDTDSWQVYLKEANKKDNKKLTTSEYGKVSPKFLDNESVCFLTGDSSGVIKIGKVNTDSKESIVIDEENEDRQVDCFDVRENKIIMSSTLNSISEKSWEDNNGEDKPISHTIYEIDDNGESMKKIAEFQASTIYSISYNSDGTKAIIGGCDVNGDSGEGIYTLSLENGKVTTILNTQSLMNTNVSEFANPNIAKISSDESLIYFTGVPLNTEEVEIDGIKCYPTAIFSYNLNNKKIEQVYNPENPSFIFDFNIKY